MLTLAFLAPSFWLALAVGSFYVLGMVFPLFIISFFLDRQKVLMKNWLNRMLGPFLLGNFISFLIFFTMGSLVIYLTLATDFSMEKGAKFVQNALFAFQNFFSAFPYSDWVFGMLMATALGFLIREGVKK